MQFYKDILKTLIHSMLEMERSKIHMSYANIPII